MEKGKNIRVILLSFTFLFFLFSLNFISAWNFEIGSDPVQTVTITINNNVTTGATSDTNESIRFNTLVGNCTADDYISGILGDGTKICGTPTGAGGAGDKWVDNGTFISPNSTYADDIVVHDVHSLDWTNVSITESQISDLSHINNSYVLHTILAGYNYFNSSTWNNIWNASSAGDGVGQNATFVGTNYTLNVNRSNIGSYNYYNGSTWDTTWNSTTSDGVGQNATFIGTNYTLNVNMSNIGSYNYFNSSTWNNIWNASSADTNETSFVTNLSAINCSSTDKMRGVYQNGTPVCASDAGGAGGNSTDEIFGVCDNSTFLKSESDPNWLANISLYYNRSDITNLGYFNSSTWNNIWNATSGDGVGQNATFIGTNYTLNVNMSNIGTYNYYNGSTWDTNWNTTSAFNSTDEIFGVCDNSSFIKEGTQLGNTTLEIWAVGNSSWTGTINNSYVLYTILFGYSFYNSTNFDIADYATHVNVNANTSAIGQNATFIGTNYTLNVNMSNIGNYNYYNGSTWDVTWNVSTETNWNANYSMNTTCISTPDCLRNITWNGTHTIWN